MMQQYHRYVSAHGIYLVTGPEGTIHVEVDPPMEGEEDYTVHAFEHTAEARPGQAVVEIIQCHFDARLCALVAAPKTEIIAPPFSADLAWRLLRDAYTTWFALSGHAVAQWILDEAQPIHVFTINSKRRRIFKAESSTRLP